MYNFQSFRLNISFKLRFETKMTVFIAISVCHTAAIKHGIANSLHLHTMKIVAIMADGKLEII